MKSIPIESTKRCLKCDNDKEFSEFKFGRDTQKYRNQCRDCCSKLINKEYRTINKDEIKVRRKNYPENIK